MTGACVAGQGWARRGRGEYDGARHGVEAGRGVTGAGRHGHPSLVLGFSSASRLSPTQHALNKSLVSPHHKLGLGDAHVALGLREGLVSVAGHGVYSVRVRD